MEFDVTLIESQETGLMPYENSILVILQEEWNLRGNYLSRKER